MGVFPRWCRADCLGDSKCQSWSYAPLDLLSSASIPTAGHDVHRAALAWWSLRTHRGLASSDNSLPGNGCNHCGQELGHFHSYHHSPLILSQSEDSALSEINLLRALPELAS